MAFTTTAQKAVGIEEFVRGLRHFGERDFHDLPLIRRYAAEHLIDPATLEPYLLYDPQHYTRNLIDKTALYELIAICWEVGQASSIHNHRGQNCWMVTPIGRLMVQNYRVLEQDLAAGTCKLEKSDQVEMNPQNPMAVDPAEPVHKVYNPREWGARAVSLHLYSRPFDSCDVYSEEQGTCGSIGLDYNTQYGRAGDRRF